jgi:hypothetical protein
MIALYVLFALASIGTLLSGVAAVMGLRNHGHLDRIDSNINGRVDQLISSTSATSHAAGVIEGHAAGVMERKEDAAP